MCFGSPVWTTHGESKVLDRPRSFQSTDEITIAGHIRIIHRHNKCTITELWLKDKVTSLVSTAMVGIISTHGIACYQVSGILGFMASMVVSHSF
jgi:hypothetical protein